MATDPVCFAQVDEDGAAFIAHYQEKKYFFCTNYCRKQFLENPKKYTRMNSDISLDSGCSSC